MKTLIRIFPMAACALAIVSLSACSKAPEDPNGTQGEAKPAATVENPVAENTATPATAVDVASLTGDATHGAIVFNQCMACHALKEGENRLGPSLHGIIGRTAGQVAGFSYSNANKSSGIVWKKDAIFKFLEAPQKMIPGTKMSFAGLTDAQDRADVIAYLDAND
jgi:cytochrome c